MSSTFTAYNKLSLDMTLIVKERSALKIQTNFGTAYDEVRFAYFGAYVSPADPNVAMAGTENYNWVSPLDRMCIGMKDSATDLYPGDPGSYWFGVTNPDGMTLTGQYNGNNDYRWVNNGTGGWSQSGFYLSATRKSFTPTTAGCALTHTPGATTAYNGCHMFRFIVQNRGLATQTVLVQTFANGGSGAPWSTYGPSDYTAAKLLGLLGGNPTWTAAYSTAMPWNDGVTAHPLPDSIWISNPFYNSRLRISCLVGMRNSPI